MSALIRSPPEPKSKLITGGFKELLEGKKYDRVSVAIRPMEALYTSQVLTVCNALAYLLKNKDAKLRIDIADLDFDMQRGNDFIPYSKNPASVKTSLELASLVRSSTLLEPLFSRRIRISRFSEMLALNEGFFAYVRGLFELETIKKAKSMFFGKHGNAYKAPFSPICPQCRHASSKFGRFSSEEETLSSTCKNSACSGYEKEFSVSINNAGSYCFFHFFDSIADAYRFEGFGLTQLHMFGIDANRRRATSDLTYFDVVAGVTSLLGNGHVPDYYGTIRLEEKSGFRNKTSFWRYVNDSNTDVVTAIKAFVEHAMLFDGSTHVSRLEISQKL